MSRSILLLSFLLAAAAANAADLTVTVVDAADQAPIAGARLVLEREDGAERRPLITGDDGTAAVTDIAQVRYLLETTASGYDPDYRELDLTADAAATVTVALTSNAFVIEELVVSATGIDEDLELQTGYVNLDAATLEGIPGIVESDPIRALQSLPGVRRPATSPAASTSAAARPTRTWC